MTRFLRYAIVAVGAIAVAIVPNVSGVADAVPRTNAMARTVSNGAGLRAVQSIAAGSGQALVIATDGTLWGWGDNTAGQLGNGSVTSTTRPVQVAGLSGVVSASGGISHSIAATSDGRLWTWGNNRRGQLGNGHAGEGEFNPDPTAVAGVTTATQVSAREDHTLVLRADGHVLAFGDNDDLELGSGVTAAPGDNQTTPVVVAGMSGAVEVRAGYFHSLARKSDGTVWAWGANFSGELGQGTTGSAQGTAFPVPGLTNVTAIAAGGQHSLALRSDGTVWAWGSNFAGQIGNGTVGADVLSPVAVAGLNHVVGIAAGSSDSFAVRDDGTVWAWGDQEVAQTGRGFSSATPTGTAVQVPGLSGVVKVAASADNAYALRNDGVLFGWGDNRTGQLGTGVRGDRTSGVQVPGLADMTSVTAGAQFSLAVRGDGTLWAWGRNAEGQLGDGTRSTRSSPVQVPGFNWLAVSAGTDFVVGLKNDGTVWTWGVNDSGQLGIPAAGARLLSPQQVPGLANARSIAAGANHALARLADGSVWAWGNNIWGEIGNGTTSAAVTSPVRVNAANLTNAVAIAAGFGYSLAIQSGGDVYGWGSNDQGQVGDGTKVDRSVPVHVVLSPGVNLTGVIGVSAGFAHSLAVKADGTVYGFGENDEAETGVGVEPDVLPQVLPPKQVCIVSAPSCPVSAAGTVAASTRSGGNSNHFGLAVLRDGSVLQWGGRVGEFSYTFVNPRQDTPRAVIGLSQVISVDAGASHLVGVRADGTVWTAGENDFGQLGTGTFDYEVSPVAAIPLGQLPVSPVPPSRLFDTRDGTGGVPVAKLGAGETLRVSVLGTHGVPASGVGAVALNVTVDGPTGDGFITVFPCGAVPLASNLNYKARQTVANYVLAPVSASGEVCFYTHQPTDLLADIASYYPTGGGVNPLVPERVFDTRFGTGGVPTGPLAAGETLKVHIAGSNGVPADAAAVNLNVTVTDPVGSGFVTVFPCTASTDAPPLASNLNFEAGQTVPNSVLVQLSATGDVCFYSHQQADLLADVNAWVAEGAGITSFTPVRVFDTRDGTGGVAARRLAAGETLLVHVLGANGVPSASVAAVNLNVTVTEPVGPGFVTVYPCSAATDAPPLASNVNYVANQTVANAVLAPVSATGDVCFHTSQGTHLLADVNAWTSST